MKIVMQIIDTRGTVKKKMEYDIPGLIEPEFEVEVYHSMVKTLFKWFIGKAVFFNYNTPERFFEVMKELGFVPSFNQLVSKYREVPFSKTIMSKEDGEITRVYYQIRIVC